MYPFSDIPAKDLFDKEDAEYLKRLAQDARSTADFFVSRIRRDAEDREKSKFVEKDIQQRLEILVDKIHEDAKQMAEEAMERQEDKNSNDAGS